MQQTLFGTDAPTTPRPLRIRELPAECQPTIRMQQIGADHLSDIELLAVLMNATTLDDASRVLAAAGGWRGLGRMSVPELRHIAGITPATATRLQATVELARRLMLALPDDRTQIRSPADAAQLLQVAIGHQDQEHLVVLLLDTKNRVQKLHTIYIGTVNSSNVRVAEVFKEAVRLNSTALIVSHNHPSQDTTPSPEDVLVTRAIVEAGQLLDIDPLDHLVVSATHYTSMRERGLGFPS